MKNVIAKTNQIIASQLWFHCEQLTIALSGWNKSPVTIICIVYREFLSTNLQNITIFINTADIFIAMYSIGTSNSITCTLDGAILYTWSDALGNTIVNGRQIVFSANDSIHNQFFACIGITQTLEVKYYYIKYITIGKWQYCNLRFMHCNVIIEYYYF